MLTVVSFGLAIGALPDHVLYPFATDRTAEQWPGDYWWMYDDQPTEGHRSP